MGYKELVKHHTQLIKDQNDNKWEIVETSDLEEICEAYHQEKLKLLSIANVEGQGEQLPCEHPEDKIWYNDKGNMQCNECGKEL